MTATLRIALLALALGPAFPAAAQEGRTFNPIARPAARPALPAGAVRISPLRPISKDRIEQAVAQIASAWNERRVDRVLAPGFQRAEELSGAMQTKVPRDAVLRVMAIQGWQVHDQYRQGGAIVSKVTITLRTQVEFGDVSAGYQVREGINEYAMTLTEQEAP
jgi:hypothetical protein